MAFLAMSSGAFAGERVIAISPSWQAIYNDVTTGGSAIERTSASTFERIVRDQGQCSKGEQVAPAWMTFSDNTQHFVGYTCEATFD